MSFELGDNKKSNNRTRESSNAAVDYHSWSMAHSEAVEPKTSKFMTVSAIIHAGLLIAVGMMAVPFVENAKVETITIELTEPVRPLPKGEITPVTRGAKSQAIAKDDIVVAKPIKQTKAAKLAMARAAKAEAHAASKQAKIAAAMQKKSAHHAAKNMTKSTARSKPIAVAHPVKMAPAAAPKLATIDDIDAPEIDKVAEEAQHSWEPSAFNDDMNDDLEKVNHQQANILAAEKSKLERDADKLDADNEQALNEAATSNKEDLAAIEDNNKARRARDAQAIAAASANEKAAQLAADREAAKANSGQGAGSRGAPDQGKLAGVPSGVRSLDQLRQMPGNPIPRYAREERLQGHQGKITYIAYVKKDGTLNQFRQLTTTGYRNLDSKTLQALQQWKFYPGQEGWVELPFRWDLKGGAQSLDGLLRVKRSDVSQM